MCSKISFINGAVHGLDNLRLSLKLLVFGALLQPFIKLVYTSFRKPESAEDDEIFFRVIICVLDSFRSCLALLKPLMVLL